MTNPRQSNPWTRSWLHGVIHGWQDVDLGATMWWADFWAVVAGVAAALSVACFVVAVVA